MYIYTVVKYVKILNKKQKICNTFDFVIVFYSVLRAHKNRFASFQQLQSTKIFVDNIFCNSEISVKFFTFLYKCVLKCKTALKIEIQNIKIKIQSIKKYTK